LQLPSYVIIIEEDGILETIMRCIIVSRGGNVRVFKTRWFRRFARRERIADDALRDAVDRAKRGLVDADLGGGLIKQRVARLGEGKSGGYRTIVVFRSGGRAIFVFGFAKSVRTSLEPNELRGYQKFAKAYLAKSEREIDGYVASGALTEVERDGEEED
jgi:hypothetical protein